MIRRVLAAVDGTDRAVEVVKIAAEVGAAFKASVYLFTALWVPPDIPAAAHNGPDDVEANIVERASERLAQLADGASGLLSGLLIEEPRISNAEPWRSILETARRLDVDLIVIGSHGYRGWDRLLGTTAAAVVNRADRHVWVVHDRGDVRRDPV